MTSTTPKYTIGVAASLLDMHPQTLRAYEARGLVSPRRTPGGTRLYSDADLARLRTVQSLTGELGLSLAGVEHVLGLEDRMRSLLDRVARLEAEIDAQAARHEVEVERLIRSYRRELVVWQPPSQGLAVRRPPAD